MKKEAKFQSLNAERVDLTRLNQDQLTKCPKCTGTRKKKTAKDFSVRVTPECILYKCHHCGFEGSFFDDKDDKDKNYVKPKWQNVSSLSDGMVTWFKSRGIDQQTLMDCKVTEGKEFMPQAGKEMNCVKFNYFRNGELVNIKFRDAKKNFRQVKEAEKIPYGMDDVSGADTLIWVEGEMDKLSLWQAGVKNVWSVPDGAPAVSSDCCSKPVIYKEGNEGGHVCRDCGKSCGIKKPNYNSKFDYLDNTHFIWSQIPNHIIATDADPSGDLLADELARRIGKNKCKRVTWDRSDKDANGTMMNKDVNALTAAIEGATDFPLEGVFYINNLKSKIYNLFNKGIIRGDTVGYNYCEFGGTGKKVQPFDQLLSFNRAYLMAVTGVPTHGKSNFVEQLLMLLSTRHKWRHGLFSPEHYPTELHFARLAEMYVGSPFFENKDHTRMNSLQMDKAIEFIGDHFYFVRPDNDDFRPQKVLDTAAELVAKHGITSFTIDPWNRMYHDLAGKSETKYVEDTLREFNVWKQQHDCLLIVVAHPTKMKKGADGQYEIPNMYDISGSAHWFNMIDLGMTVYRNFKEDWVEVYVQKVKHRYIGDVGHTIFNYDLKNSRYYQKGIQPSDRPYYEINTNQERMNIPERPFEEKETSSPITKEDIDAIYDDDDLPF